jgi:hypothetical protein
MEVIAMMVHMDMILPVMLVVRLAKMAQQLQNHVKMSLYVVMVAIVLMADLL